MFMHPLRHAVSDKLDRISEHVFGHYGHLVNHSDRVATGDYTAVMVLYGCKEKVWNCDLKTLAPYRSAVEGGAK